MGATDPSSERQGSWSGTGIWSRSCHTWSDRIALYPLAPYFRSCLTTGRSSGRRLIKSVNSGPTWRPPSLQPDSSTALRRSRTGIRDRRRTGGPTSSSASTTTRSTPNSTSGKRGEERPETGSSGESGENSAVGSRSNTASGLGSCPTRSGPAASTSRMRHAWRASGAWGRTTSSSSRATDRGSGSGRYG